MARIGDFVNPALGRTDYSGFRQGAQQGGAMIGQGIANLGQGIGQAVTNFKEKQQKKQQTEALNSFLEQAAKSGKLESIGVTEENYKELAKDMVKAFDGDPGKALNAIGTFAQMQSRSQNAGLREREIGLAEQRFSAKQKAKQQVEQMSFDSPELALESVSNIENKGSVQVYQDRESGKYRVSFTVKPTGENKEDPSVYELGATGKKIALKRRLESELLQAVKTGDRDRAEKITEELNGVRKEIVGEFEYEPLKTSDLFVEPETPEDSDPKEAPEPAQQPNVDKGVTLMVDPEGKVRKVPNEKREAALEAGFTMYQKPKKPAASTQAEKNAQSLSANLPPPGLGAQL